MKTSVNIKPCNIGSSEAHNRRTPEYLAHIGEENFYVRTDLMADNETWVAPDFGATSLSELYDQIAAMVKDKTGRTMQTKDRERVNKKTGKVTVVRGSTPLKEGVVVIKDDTTLEQLQRFCEVCRERWGITALQIFIHRDEGHYGTPGDTATWKPNLHARIKAMLDMLNEALREAVRGVIEFSRSVLREFSMRHREAVVDYLSTAPDVKGAANSIKIFARPFLDDRQFDKGSRELDRLTSNFPSVQEDVNRTQKRGLRR